MKSAVAITWKMLASLFSMSSFIRQLSCWDGSGEFHYTLGCYNAIDQKPQQTRSQDFFYKKRSSPSFLQRKSPRNEIEAPDLQDRFLPLSSYSNSWSEYMT